MYTVGGEALHMTPTQLLIGSLVGVVEAHSNYVICSKDLLEDWW